MMNSQFTEAIDYARERFGDAAAVEVVGVDECVILRNASDAVDIELNLLGEYFVVFAGSFWYEAQVPGCRPVLWFMDLVMTFGVVEFRALLANVSLAAPPESVARYGRLPWRRELRRWSAWSGQVAERSAVAEQFGMSDAFGPNEAKSIVVSLRHSVRIARGE